MDELRDLPFSPWVMALSGTAMMVQLGLTLWVLGRAIRRRRDLGSWRLALAVATGVLVTALLAAALLGRVPVPAGWPGPAWSALLLSGAWDWVRTVSFVQVGVACGAAVGEERLPLLRRGWPGRHWPLLPLGLGIAFLVWTAALFHLTEASVPDSLLAFVPAEPPLRRVGSVIQSAIIEEIFYRLGFQSLLAVALRRVRRGSEVAWVATALLWTALHLGTIEPAWLKPVQIFPIGLALGWLARRRGIEACILAHALWNVGGLIPGVAPM